MSASRPLAASSLRLLACRLRGCCLVPLAEQPQHQHLSRLQRGCSVAATYVASAVCHSDESKLDQIAKTRQKLYWKIQILNVRQWPETEIKWICWNLIRHLDKLVKAHQGNLFLASFSRLKPGATEAAAVLSAASKECEPIWNPFATSVDDAWGWCDDVNLTLL